MEFNIYQSMGEPVAIAQPTLYSLHPHTLSMDKHRTLRYGLHIVFDDACPSNATLYHGHKYTLT